MRVAVLIPALNEEEALSDTLSHLPPGDVDAVLVVDNGSRDRTPEVARSRGAGVIVEPRRGYGSACLAGIRCLAELPRPPQVVVFVDADAGEAAAHVTGLVRPIVSGEADLVLGTRVPASPGSGSSVPLHARLGNRLVLVLVRLLFGRRFRDLAPFRAIRADRLDELAMDDRDWGWTLQMQVRAIRRGLRILEVPVPQEGRTAGRSKISGTLLGSARAGGKMLYTVVRERLRPARSLS